MNRILDEVRRRGDRRWSSTRAASTPGLPGPTSASGPPGMQAGPVGGGPRLPTGAEPRRGADRVLPPAAAATVFMTLERPGTMLGQVVNPVRNARAYTSPAARGGATPLVSSVLMGAIPARVAGVERDRHGDAADGREARSRPSSRGRAQGGGRRGLQGRQRLGHRGARFRDATVPRADVIVGAREHLRRARQEDRRGHRGIDIVAGPSEVLVIADDRPIPSSSRPICWPRPSTTHRIGRAGKPSAGSGGGGAGRGGAAAPGARARGDRSRIDRPVRGGFVVVTDLQARSSSPTGSPRSTSSCTCGSRSLFSGGCATPARYSWGRTPRSRSGDTSPGPTTSCRPPGTARFASALSVDHFLKRTSVIHYSQAAFRREAQDMLSLARVEGLDAHARSVSVRLEGRRKR